MKISTILCIYTSLLVQFLHKIERESDGRVFGTFLARLKKWENSFELQIIFKTLAFTFAFSLARGKSRTTRNLNVFSAFLGPGNATFQPCSVGYRPFCQC